MSVALAPITLTAGPVATYNVASLALPVLAAWFTYRLCLHLTGSFAPALLAGAVFGFGSYTAAHLLGHLNLVSAVFLVPAAVHLVLLYIEEAISRRRFVVLMVALLSGQLLLSAEVLLTGLVFGALALLLAYGASDWELRSRDQARRCTHTRGGRDRDDRDERVSLLGCRGAWRGRRGQHGGHSRSSTRPTL